MGLVRQCDRCGKTFRPYIKMAGHKSNSNYTRVHVMSAQYLENNYDGNKSKYWDLCPCCEEQLAAFLEQPDINVFCDATSTEQSKQYSEEDDLQL